MAFPLLSVYNSMDAQNDRGANLESATEDECWDGLDDRALFFLLLLLLFRHPKLPVEIFLLAASSSAAFL